MTPHLADRLARLALMGIAAVLRGWTAVLGLRPELPAGGRWAVLRNGNIGDHLAALPAYRALRAANPTGQLVLLTTAGASRGFGRDLLDVAAVFDEVVELPGGGGRAQAAEAVAALRAAGCDALAYLPSDKASLRQVAWHAWLVRRAGIRRAAGFGVGKLRLFARSRAGLVLPSEADRLLGVARGLLGGDAPANPLPTHRVEVEPVAPGIPGPVAAICPGGEVPVNRWPVEKYAALARHLVEECGWSVLILGARKEEADAARIAAGLPADRVRNLAGRTTLREAAGLLAGCSVLVSNDTGIGHLAAAVGTPVATVFSARDFAGSWLPHGPNIGVRARVSCEVCYRRSCPTMHCIRSISVDSVAAAVERLASNEPHREIVFA